MEVKQQSTSQNNSVTSTKSQYTVSAGSSSSGTISTDAAASNEIFSILRPVTIQVMSSPTVQNLEQLITIVEHLPDVVEPCILDYILYPLNHHLKLNRKHREDVRIILNNCLRIVLEKWQIETFTAFAELYQFSMISICKTDDPGNFDKGSSEKVVTSVVEAIHALVEKSLTKHFKKLYSERYIAAVGHGICILLQVVNQDTLKSLRILAIRIVVLLIKICEGDAEICHRIFKFLPGLATTFVRCSLIQGGRYHVDIIRESLEGLKISLTTCISFEKPEDLVTVDSNLRPGIGEISELLVFHSEARLQSALAEFSSFTIREALTKLPKCSEVLCNNIFILASNNDDKDASAKCLAVLRDPNNKKWVSEMCSFKALDHELKKSVIQSNVGELKKCCHSSFRVASSIAVSPVTEIDMLTILPRITDLRTTVLRRKLELDGKNLATEDGQIEKSCLRMCHFLLETYQLQSIISEFDTLLGSLNTWENIMSLKATGGIQLFNEFLTHFLTNKTKFVDAQLLEPIAEKYAEFLNPLLLTICDRNNASFGQSSKSVQPKQQDPKKHDSIPLSIIDAQCRCALEGIPILVELCPEIIEFVILRLVEYAGLREIHFSKMAATALGSLKRVAAYRKLTLTTLLAEYLDIVMSEIGTKIEKISECPHLTDALIFLAKYFDFSQDRFMYFIEQIIQLSTVYQTQTNFQLALSNVYYAFIYSMWHWYLNKGVEVTDRRKRVTVKQFKEEGSLYERILNYQNCLGISLDPASEDDENLELLTEENMARLSMENSQEHGNETLQKGAQDDDKKEKLSQEISLTLLIAQKTTEYLTNPSRAVRLMALEILIKAIELLSNTQDELLPLLHQCWGTLTSRFEEDDYIVLRKSFELLITMVNYSGDFLRSRTVDGIFPMLSGFLLELANQSKNKSETSHAAHTFTQGYKLQYSILAGLAELCEAMKITETDLDKVADACIIYLSPEQHPKLRVACISLLTSLGDGVNGSTIWMKLIAHNVIPAIGQPPHLAFKTARPEFGTEVEMTGCKKKRSVASSSNIDKRLTKS